MALILSVVCFILHYSELIGWNSQTWVKATRSDLVNSTNNFLICRMSAGNHWVHKIRPSEIVLNISSIVMQDYAYFVLIIMSMYYNLCQQMFGGDSENFYVLIISMKMEAFRSKLLHSTVKVHTNLVKFGTLNKCIYSNFHFRWFVPELSIGFKSNQWVKY